MIKGWVKNSFIDYPGKVCSTVFVSRCNFRCPYCHNGSLILEGEELDSIDDSAVFSFLKKRKGLIDGVVISGGEPTLYNDLFYYIKKIKKIGLLVKLDTNGSNPSILKRLLELKHLDFIAMDIKNSPARYCQTIGMPVVDIDKINKSIGIIKNSTVQYEFRTTVLKEMHTEKDILDIGKWLKGSSRYVLQKYRESDTQLSKETFTPYSNNEMLEFQMKLKPYFQEVIVRGA